MHHASLLKEVSIVELSAFLLAYTQDKMTDHFVDVGVTLSRAEVIDFLKIHTLRTELSYHEYAPCLMNPCRASQVEPRAVIERKIGFAGNETVNNENAVDEDNVSEGIATSPSTSPLEDGS